MTVFAPSSYEEVGNMLHEAMSITTGPVAIRWPKSEACSALAVGTGLRARKVRPGSGVCLIGLGKFVAACEEAAQVLSARGLKVTVWDARVAAPLDGKMIEDALCHQLVVSVEDGITDGGVGWRIESALRHRAGNGTGPTVVSCGVPTAYLPHGDAAGILRDLGLDGPGIAQVVLERL
jgi:1-deoxy-D-xylulose-5-phosphate synthase